MWWKATSLILAVVVLALGYLAWADHQLKEAARRKEAAEAERQERQDSSAKTDAEVRRAEAVAIAFMSTLKSREGNHQLGLTTKAFQERHRASGGVVRVEKWSSFEPIKEGSSLGLAWQGSLEDGEMIYRGKIADRVDEYTLVLTRDRRTGVWRVDSFVIPDG